MKKGDKIIWVYQHWLNSKSYTWKVKEGTFLRAINPKLNRSGFLMIKRAVVQFDGNKNTSTIPFRELEKAKL